VTCKSLWWIVCSCPMVVLSFFVFSCFQIAEGTPDLQVEVVGEVQIARRFCLFLVCVGCSVNLFIKDGFAA
jgi:hypothetical protein